ncbi:hypothetical protein ACJX0J_020421, partial [Zea mays]
FLLLEMKHCCVLDFNILKTDRNRKNVRWRFNGGYIKRRKYSFDTIHLFIGVGYSFLNLQSFLQHMKQGKEYYCIFKFMGHNKLDQHTAGLQRNDFLYTFGAKIDLDKQASDKEDKDYWNWKD